MLSTSTGRWGRDFRISASTSRPVRPGIVMSSTTTSHSFSQTLVMASCAVPASPNTARLNSSAKICFKPWRTTAWWCAIRIFMGNGVARRRMRPRDLDGDHGALAGFTLEADLAAEQRGALTHPDQPDGSRVVDLRGGDAAAVVFDDEEHAPLLLAGADDHPGGTGVPHDVGERLLEDAEEGRVQVGIERGIVPQRAGHVALDAGAALEFVGLPFERGDEPQIIENAGAQLRRDPAHRLDGGVNVPGHGLDLVVERPLADGLPAREPREVQFQAGERLAEFVMHLAGDAGALLLAHILQIDGEGAQLLVGFAQAFLRAFPLGALAGLAQRAVHRRHELRKPGLEHVVRGAALEGFDRPPP